jgi:hypothetical protein
MRVFMKLLVFLFISACGRSPDVGPAVRLGTGSSDTLIVNNRSPTTLSVHAFDPAGRTIPTAPIHFTWLSGDSVPVDTVGVIACQRAGDLMVRASLGRLSTNVFVRCRPTQYVRIPGPIQFILGDPEMMRPVVLPVAAYAANGRPVTLFDATLRIKDEDIASINGLTVSPRSRGITLAWARVGNVDAGIGVHIYQRVNSLSALDTLLRVPPGQRLFAVPLRLGSGALFRQRLPPGGWMLTMLPENDHDPYRIHLRVENAHCGPNFLNTPRRWGCGVRDSAAVVLYRPYRKSDTSVDAGYLLVRWLFG